MRTKDQMRPYQNRLGEALFARKRLLLAVDMGLGKTVSTATGLSDLLDCGEVQRVLVVAPLRVAKETWPTEFQQWEHLGHISVSAILGTEKQRLKALEAGAQVEVINRENLPWLCELLLKRDELHTRYQAIVWDESTSLKSGKKKTPKGKPTRFGWAAHLARCVDRFYLLSGTPTPEGLEGLWGQMYVLDLGERLGKYKSHFMNRFYKDKGYNYPDWHLLPGAEKQILDLTADLMIGLKSEDVLQLPDRIDHTVFVDLPAAAKKAYKDMAADLVIALDNDTEAVSKNAGVLVGKLSQIANGAVYDEDRGVHELHTAKLEALADLVEEAETNVLVFYSYQHDLSRLKKKFPNAVVLSEDPTAVQRWNNKQVPLLLAHPASAGHGLNLQYGGRCCVWFGLPWSLELYQQANKRLHRSGVDGAVNIYHILARDTVDERIYAALNDKGGEARRVLDFVCAGFR